MRSIEEMSAALQSGGAELGLPLSSEVVAASDVAMARIVVQDRDEFPIYLTIDDGEIQCLTHLFRESEVHPERRTDLLEALLTMNLPMALSSFGKVGNQYVIFGALRVDATDAEIEHEICVLSQNTLSAVEALKEYLN